MSEGITVAAITAGGLLTASVIASVLSFVQSRKNTEKITEVHVLFNSRMDQLIKASVALGRQEERDSQSITVHGVPEK